MEEIVRELTHLENRTKAKRERNGAKREQSAEEINRHGVLEAMSREIKRKEHRVDALALIAEEGRGKLRKAAGSRKQALSRRYPNGETRREKSRHRAMNT